MVVYGATAAATGGCTTRGSDWLAGGGDLAGRPAKRERDRK